MPPALVRCHVVVDSSLPEDRATESHNHWTTTTGSPHVHSQDDALKIAAATLQRIVTTQ
jgi:hypothetical protein